MRKTLTTIGICWLLCLTLAAQDWNALDTDALFALARKTAFAGNRTEARNMLQEILRKSPGYDDVRVFLARTYAWDGQRAQARQELQQVLNRQPENEDAINALADVEMWDDQYTAALTVIDGGLQHYPTSEDLLYKRASVLQDLNRPEEALASLDQLLTINPAHQKAVRLRLTIKSAQLRYALGISYNLDLFSRTFDPAQAAAVQLSRSNNWGSSIVRLNYAHRFGEQGLQPEVDLYPRIADGVYAYLNYGYSASSLFPNHRVGAEVFSKLPRSFEASAGLRYLYFDADSKVTIYTGSIGYYFKSYWVSLRPYITPDKETGTSFSATLFLRRYFQDRDNYIGINAGAGFSPDDRRFQSSSGLSTDGLYLLRSQRAGIAWTRSLRYDFIVNASLDFVRQELLFDQGEYVLITSISVGVRKKF